MRSKTWIKSHLAHGSCGFCKQSGDSHIKSHFYTEEGDRAVGFAGKTQLIEQQRDSRSSFLGLPTFSCLCVSIWFNQTRSWASVLAFHPVRTQNWNKENNFLGMTDFPAFGLQQGGCRHSLDWMLPSGTRMRSRAYRKQKNHRRNSNFPESHK